jgi:hypothetical protein
MNLRLADLVEGSRKQILGKAWKIDPPVLEADFWESRIKPMGNVVNSVCFLVPKSGTQDGYAPS